MHNTFIALVLYAVTMKTDNFIYEVYNTFIIEQNLHAVNNYRD